MPELPEVETIRRQLLPYCQGEQLVEIRFRTPGLLKNSSLREVTASLQGKTLTDIQRKGKFLIFNFQGKYLVVHLGMSGIFLKEESESRYPQHIHVEFHFRSSKSLYFQDMRKFGKIRFYHSEPELSTVGIDPLNDDLSDALFFQLLSRRKSNLKLFLMNQAYIAGIGNIYANEILYLAKLSPYRRTNEVTPAEAARLLAAIRQVLQRAIERFGTTYSAYRTVNGTEGENQHFLKVYHRNDHSCPNCGELIVKTVLGNRSTFFCPRCQQ